MIITNMRNGLIRTLLNRIHEVVDEADMITPGDKIVTLFLAVEDITVANGIDINYLDACLKSAKDNVRRHGSLIGRR